MSNYIRRTKYNIRYDILYEIVYLKLKFYGVVVVMETEWIHSVGAMEQRVKEQSCVSTHTHTQDSFQPNAIIFDWKCKYN